MFCTNCGKKIESSDLFCKYCGHKNNKESITVEPKEENSNLKIASIIFGSIALLGNVFVVFSFLSILLAIIGLILALCALKKGPNTLGIVLNSISIVLSIILIAFMIRFLKRVPQMINDKFNSSNIIEKYNGGDFDLNEFFDGFDLNDFFNGFTDGDFNIDEYTERKIPDQTF